MPKSELVGNIGTKRHTDTCHFERVSKAIVYEDAPWQWEYLGLILQSSERCRENEAVIIALELRTVVMTLWMAMLLSEPYIGY